ncbi:sporulation integral membrane protein YlbJ [Bacillaceae bacterium W0354]
MKEIFKTIFYTSSTIFLAISIINFPNESFEASIRGLNLWLEVVFPSLLPFFIVSELFLAFGIVRLIGILIEPLMRPLFNIPGAGGVVIGIGMASGYPAGAKITARLRQEGVLSQIEAERLVSFTNASNPLFIFGAVAIGFFHDAKTGLLLATSHYVGAIIVGICMRFYYHRHRSTLDEVRKDHRPIYKKMWETLHHERVEKSEPLGQILGQAITSSIKTLVLIGGFIVLFSVLNKLLLLTGITALLSDGLGLILKALTLPEVLSLPFIAGLFEVTLGAQMVANSENVILLTQLVFVSAMLAFHGFSIQAQVASILSTTDIRFAPYFFARLLHIVFSVILTIILFRPLYLNRETTPTSNLPVDTTQDASSLWVTMGHWLEVYGPLITYVTIALGCIILITQSLKKA